MWYRNHLFSWVVAAGAVFLASDAALSADDDPAAEPPAAAEIHTLIEQLDADSFAERQSASEQLGRIGKPAIEALGKATGSESLEVLVRAIDILKGLMESDDADTQAAAKAALERVAETDRAAAARRAADALKAVEAKRAPAVQRFGGGLQIAVAGAGAQRINVRTVNGVKTIEADEADRKVKIVDDPKEGIKMEVTSKKEGKDVTEKYEVKDAEALKKQHPDAYKIYDKYKQMGGGGAFAVQLQVGNVQRLAPAKRPNPIDTAARMLPAWGSTLDRMATDEAIREASKESNEALKKKVGEVKDRLEQLESRLQKAIEEAEAPPKEATPNEEK